jgi:group I intron endonuclease
MTYGIYCIEHIESGRKYVGKSKHIERRIYEHFRKSGKSKHCFAHALRKYGEAAFRWEVLEEIIPECPKALAAAELHWIDTLGVFASDKGFNVKRDSSSCTEFAPEVKAKISASLTGKKHTEETIARFRLRAGGNNPFTGKTHTDQTRATIGERSKAVWADPEYREKMKQRKKAASRKGSVTPEDVRAKQSESAKRRAARGLSPETRQKLSERAKLQWARQKGLTQV